MTYRQIGQLVRRRRDCPTDDERFVKGRWRCVGRCQRGPMHQMSVDRQGGCETDRILIERSWFVHRGRRDSLCNLPSYAFLDVFIMATYPSVTTTGAVGERFINYLMLVVNVEGVYRWCSGCLRELGDKEIYALLARKVVTELAVLPSALVVLAPCFCETDPYGTLRSNWLNESPLEFRTWLTGPTPSKAHCCDDLATAIVFG